MESEERKKYKGMKCPVCGERMEFDWIGYYGKKANMVHTAYKCKKCNRVHSCTEITIEEFNKRFPENEYPPIDHSKHYRERLNDLIDRLNTILND